MFDDDDDEVREDEKWGFGFIPTTELLDEVDRVLDPVRDDFDPEVDDEDDDDDDGIRCASRAPPPPAEIVVPREGPEGVDDEPDDAVDVPLEKEDDEVIGPLDVFESFCLVKIERKKNALIDKLDFYNPNLKRKKKKRGDNEKQMRKK